MQWVEIVRDAVHGSRERGDTDQRAFAATLREALGERSLPPELTRILTRAAAGKFRSIDTMRADLDEVTRRRTGRGALWAILGVAMAAAFGFVVAYGC